MPRRRRPCNARMLEVGLAMICRDEMRGSAVGFGGSRRSLVCECDTIRRTVRGKVIGRDPHPGGWCKTCGRTLPKEG